MFVACALIVPRRALAESSAAVIEIDPAAEAILDARAVRRQVSLEVSEIRVDVGGGTSTPLFVRVLGRDDHKVEVQLWARGELADRRVVSGAESGQHLLVRRVALAAAELARRLRQRHIAAERLRRREMAALQKLAAQSARRTFEGPLALRAEGFGSYGRDFWSVGSGVSAEISLRRSFRVDLGARFLGGFEPDASTRLSWLELSLGPALRVRPSSHLDIDLAAFVAAASVHVSGVSKVDELESTRDTWTARGGVATRLQPRLTRWARLSIGAEGGLVLRPLPVELSDGRREQLGGFYVGGALGVVITPR
ncbi:MAG: hypothetical protein ACOY0T_39135 [Myxococcota bacterium]